MRFPKIPLLLTALFLSATRGQETPENRLYLIRSVAFYNLENLFDTHNDSLAHDDARTPGGTDRWTEARLESKLESLSRVLSELGSEYGANPPDVLGVCEVENRMLLERLLQQPSLKPFAYGILHFDSPDPRGIDVALLYREDRFFPQEQRSFRLLIHDAHGNRKYTRDQLVVSGFLDQDFVHVLVNHWPSRGGGAQSREHRKAAALRQRGLVDSIRHLYPGAKIIAMGDFNDNPTDASLQILCGRRKKQGRAAAGDFHNPLARDFGRGAGSLAFRDRWNLFDQVLFSQSWMDPEPGTYRFWRAGIFRPAYLKTREGGYRGYPYRTYAGGRYQGGFSDHFPVCAFVIRPAGKDPN